MPLETSAKLPDCSLAGSRRIIWPTMSERNKKGSGGPKILAKRLQDLRAELAARGLQGFLVPRADEHQGEYIPPHARRLEWLSGFDGSAGLAVVLAERAAIFVDGRYTLQLRQQTDSQLYEPRHLIDEPPGNWIDQHLAGGRLGYDPWLHSERAVERLAKSCTEAGGELVACADNPLDTVWPDRPPPPAGPMVPHEERFAGETAADKRQRLAAELARDDLAAAVLTAPDSIAWLLNLRGSDVEHTPLPLSFAILHADGEVELFAAPEKLGSESRIHLGNGVRPRAPDELAAGLAALAGQAVRVEAESAAAWVFQQLRQAGAEIRPGADPCQLPKACKNATELAGMRAAHRRDGVALVHFFAWLDGNAPGRGIDELKAAERLRAWRAEGEHFRGLSFDTISAAGANGAIVHYRVDRTSNRRLEAGSLYLVDSGAQYLDGTTDVTRTVAIGQPDDDMRTCFTHVLKGHIALARARFPAGTTGAQLDPLARSQLWQAGLDYDHGTGHGVGCYLGVHEGPQRIAKSGSAVALEPGMIVSNEPGYYRQDAFGIRIENLLAVVELESGFGGDKAYLGFETLTRAPIDRRLIVPGLLTSEETAWLDAYHATVRAEIAPLLDAATADWLAQACAPI